MGRRGIVGKAEDIVGCDFLVLYFTTENREEISSVIKDYLTTHSKRDDITRGLYYRGSI